jgi:hypothetical protein
MLNIDELIEKLRAIKAADPAAVVLARGINGWLVEVHSVQRSTLKRQEHEYAIEVGPHMFGQSV